MRMALGAQRRDILGMVLGEGIRLAAAGVALGVGLAYAATLAVVGALCLAMVIAGSFFPALRAARTDPMAAIKAE